MDHFLSFLEWDRNIQSSFEKIESSSIKRVIRFWWENTDSNHKKWWFVHRDSMSWRPVLFTNLLSGSPPGARTGPVSVCPPHVECWRKLWMLSKLISETVIYDFNGPPNTEPFIQVRNLAKGWNWSLLHIWSWHMYFVCRWAFDLFSVAVIWSGAEVDFSSSWIYRIYSVWQRDWFVQEILTEISTLLRFQALK